MNESDGLHLTETGYDGAGDALDVISALTCKTENGWTVISYPVSKVEWPTYLGINPQANWFVRKWGALKIFYYRWRVNRFLRRNLREFSRTSENTN